MIFYPPNAPIPAGLTTDEFILEPLTTEHVHLDHAALMESVAMLRAWSGGDWPTHAFTVAQNYQDLAMHQTEHEERVAFTFTVLTPDRSRCIGCVYMDDLTNVLTFASADPAQIAGVPDGSVAVRFWATQPRLADDLDAQLFACIRSWLHEKWTFAHIFFRTNDRDQRQVDLFEGANLMRSHTLQVPTLRGQVVLYRDPAA